MRDCNDKMEEGYIYHDEWSDNEVEKHDTHTFIGRGKKLILQIGPLLQLVFMFRDINNFGTLIDSKCGKIIHLMTSIPCCSIVHGHDF